MNFPKVRFIADLVAEHFDELQFLWGQRRNALCSPFYTGRTFHDLEERIEGHAQGVLAAGYAAHGLLEVGLTSKDSLCAFAAAYLMLRSGEPELTGKIVTALQATQQDGREGIREALCHAPIAGLEGELRALVAAAAPAVAVAAAEALARHDELAQDEGRLEALLTDEDCTVRQAAWRVVALVDRESRP
jgi:hypothetical protein